MALDFGFDSALHGELWSYGRLKNECIFVGGICFLRVE
jgi:hypothetical protein